jgi:hypothetical protein
MIPAGEVQNAPYKAETRLSLLFYITFAPVKIYE